ncbi:MAG: hypothetical protein ACRBC3_01055 [Burkholderiaceae bacterium]
MELTKTLVSLTTKVTAAAALAIVIAGCASSGSSQSIPPYTGKDQVGAVSKDMIIGNWSGRVLNPVQGQPTNNFTATFSQDGKTVYNVDNGQSGMNLKFQMIGTWTVEGDLITTQLDSINEVSGNALGGLMAKMMSSMRDRMSGSANVYEASANRLVLVGKEGQAQEFTRLP